MAGQPFGVRRFSAALVFQAAREKQKRRKSAALQNGCRMCALAVNLFLPLAEVDRKRDEQVAALFS